MRLYRDGQLEPAYQAIAKAHSQQPRNEKVQKAFAEMRDALVERYHDLATATKPRDLPVKRDWLQKAAALDPNHVALAEELNGVNAEISGVDADAARSVDAADPLTALQIYRSVAEYRDFMPSVRRAYDHLASQSPELLAAIDELATRDSGTARFSYLVAAANALPDLPALREARDKVLKDLSDAARDAARKHRSHGSERTATVLLCEALAVNYGGMIDPASRSHEKLCLAQALEGLARSWSRNVVLLTGDSFSAEQKAVFLRSAGAELSSRAIRLTTEADDDYRLTENDVVVICDLRDCSVDPAPKDSREFSRYLAGTRQVPNPEYDQALLEYTAAEQNLNRAAALAPSSGILGLAVIVNARQARDAAAFGLQATPRYLSEPAYEDYQYRKTVIRCSLLFELSYTVIDPHDPTRRPARNVHLENVETLTAIAGAHPKDVSGIEDKEVGEADIAAVLKAFFHNSCDRAVRELRDAALRTCLVRAATYAGQTRYEDSVEQLLRHRLLSGVHASCTEAAGEYAADRIDVIGILGMPDVTQVCEQGCRVDPPVCDVALPSLVQATMKHAIEGPYANDKLATLPESFDVTKAAGTAHHPTSHPVMQLSSLNVRRRSAASAAPASNQGNVARRALESVVIVRTLTRTGSGFALPKPGHILTNYHVIENQKDISVETPDGRKYFADVVATVRYKDLAVLHIGASLPPLMIGTASPQRVGDCVYALGAPGAVDGPELLTQTVTKGIVSAVRRRPSLLNPTVEVEYVQTDAAISPGNSGGPLIDEQGRVLGVNTRKEMGVRQEGLGFAVSVNEIRKSLAEYCEP